MDIVFLYKKSKDGSENELKFSIRSAEKNLQFDKLIVIGDRPEFLNDKAIYIDCTLEDDKEPRNCLFKHIDMKAKAEALIEDERVAEDIIWCNDDMYIMQPYENGFPYYYSQKSLEEWFVSGNNWEIVGGKRSKMWNGYVNEVYKAFPKGNWYEIHCPIVFNKKKLAKVIKKHKLKHLGTIRSFYCNEYKVGGEPTRDYKIHTVQHFREYKRIAPFLSTTNVTGRWPPFIDFLRQKFNQKSTYEK